MKIKNIILTFGMFLCFFSISHIVLNKFSSDPSVGLFSALADTFLVYLFGGVAAFQIIINSPEHIPGGAMFIGLKQFFPSWIDYPDSAILPWVKVGGWNTNVYTAHGYWFSAFGVFYPVLVGSVLGFFAAVVEYFSTMRFGLLRFYKIFFLFCLGFTFFGDQFLTSVNMHLGFMLSSILVGLSSCGVRTCMQR